MNFLRGLRLAVYIAIAVIVLTLSGIFTSFAERDIIPELLSLNLVTLVLMIGCGAYAAGSRVSGRQRLPASVAGGLIVGVALAAIVFIEANIDLRFVFSNMLVPLTESITFGQPVPGGLLVLLVVSALVGAAVGGLLVISARWRAVVLLALLLTVVLGLLENQIRDIVTLGDALLWAIAFALGYALNWRLQRDAPEVRALLGGGAGLIIGVIAALLASAILSDESVLRSATPIIVIFTLAFAGAAGGLAARGVRVFHHTMIYLAVGLLAIGILNAAEGMTPFAAVAIFLLIVAAAALVPRLGSADAVRYTALARPAQQRETRLAFLTLLIVLLAVPLLTGQYITNVLNLTGLYIVMGIGLNIVVGYAGLLDLGYVAFFAIGAYTVGLLTTPSLLTCGGVPPETITPDNVTTLCTGLLTFWQAWPVAIIVSAIFGMLLGIPVLRLRGDYLAIVTLGFGEIIRIVVKFDDFKPLFGAAQGIDAIPRPILDLTSLNPAWRFELTGETGIFYLVLFTILVTAFMAGRLGVSRLGRAWRAMRADEDVAQQMGINLTRTKLAAFAIGAAFAGMGGAIAATRLYGAYPDSFTVLVSINVLCIVIIGGLGSIPGVIVGALVLVGLPEALRELSDYRLLAFGVLLVAAMLLRPQGILPPAVRRLSQLAEGRLSALGRTAP